MIGDLGVAGILFGIGGLLPPRLDTVYPSSPQAQSSSQTKPDQGA